MDPITGFSRRGLIALGAAVVFGIVAATVASFVEERAEGPCPDRTYGCATFHAGEPILIGAMFPISEGPGRRTVQEAVERRGGHLLGRPLHVLAWGSECSAEGGAQAARELATDPPDGPPVVGVIGGSCGRATIPAAQILSDSGITLVSVTGAEIPATAGRPPFYLRATGPVPVGQAADAMLDAAERLAVPGRDGDVLVPRTPLRDALVSAGFAEAR